MLFVITENAAKAQPTAHEHTHSTMVGVVSMALMYACYFLPSQYGAYVHKISFVRLDRISKATNPENEPFEVSS
jgi:hypothetical protein